MLLCLPPAAYQKATVINMARTYTKLLYSVPIAKAKQSTEIEVMPYEMLWTFVLESLDRQSS